MVGRVQVLTVHYCSLHCGPTMIRYSEESVEVVGRVQVLTVHYCSLKCGPTVLRYSEESVEVVGRVQVLASADELMDGREEQQQARTFFKTDLNL